MFMHTKVQDCNHNKKLMVAFYDKKKYSCQHRPFVVMLPMASLQ